MQVRTSIIDPVIQQALAREESTLAPTIRRRAMANNFQALRCTPLPDSIAVYMQNSRPAINTESAGIELTSRGIREVATLSSEFSVHSTTCVQHPLSGSASAPPSFDYDPVEADFLASGDMFLDEEDEDDQEISLSLSDSPVIEDDELNSGAPSLTGLAWTLKSALPIPRAQNMVITGLKSILTETTCNYGEFKSLINKKTGNRYTPVIQDAINKINVHKLINDHEQVKHYAEVIQHCMCVACLQLYK